jgi:acetolactate synthase-1/2/3 large subunit
VTVAQYIAHFIAQKETPAVFQLSGGMIAFLTDAIESLGVTPIVHNRHEQASGFGAEGATRISGKTAVAMGTSGPGATNLLTPISSCFFDSTPAIFLTGQVRTDEIKKHQQLRQNGFQELDICAMAETVCKSTFRVRDAADVPRILNEAWNIANSGRKGPVLIDIPIDIQQDRVAADIVINNQLQNDEQIISSDDLNQIRYLLSTAQKPLAIIGGGVRLAGAVQECQDFLMKSGLPHVTTLMGIDSVDHSSVRYLGYLGSYGNSWSNNALKEADLILVLGSRLDVRQIGSNPLVSLANKKIIRIDIDANELHGKITPDIGLQCSLRNFFDQIDIEGISIKYEDMCNLTFKLKQLNPQYLEQEVSVGINPTLLMEEISNVYAQSNGYSVDVGQHQMWAAQSISLKRNQRFITSGGLGAMGFAIPAAVGSSLAKQGRWVVIVGDGCMQLSLQELQTISQMDLPITICIINNNQHGMVAQFQEENMDSRFFGTRKDFSNPNYAEISSGFGIKNYSLIRSLEDFERVKPNLLHGSTCPEILEFSINNSMKALPKMSFKSD